MNRDHIVLAQEPWRELSEKKGTLWGAGAFLRVASWVSHMLGTPYLLMPAHFPFSVDVLSLLCTPWSRIPNCIRVPRSWTAEF